MSGAGLLFVLSEPGTVDEAEFHDWYDHEHGPARVALAGFDHGTRWRATDGERPTWLATYDVSDLAVLAEPAYTTLREQRSSREQAVVAGLAIFERRTYGLLTDTPAPGWTAPAPGPYQLAVSLDVPADAEQELADWYAEEHVPVLHRVEGWLGTRRYRLLGTDGQSVPRWLALHDLTAPHVFDAPAYAASIGTGRRDSVMARVTRRERRLFEVHRRF